MKFKNKYYNFCCKTSYSECRSLVIEILNYGIMYLCTEISGSKNWLDFFGVLLSSILSIEAALST